MPSASTVASTLKARILGPSASPTFGGRAQPIDPFKFGLQSIKTSIETLKHVCDKKRAMQKANDKKS